MQEGERQGRRNAEKEGDRTGGMQEKLGFRIGGMQGVGCRIGGRRTGGKFAGLEGCRTCGSTF